MTPDATPGTCAVVRVPCTCGELFQGALDGRPCLVSCPIDSFSSARVVSKKPSQFRPNPLEGRRKINLAMDGFARRTGKTLMVEVATPLPAGRGYGTSTADIGAALCAASQAQGLELPAEEMSRAAAAIEPTDSTLFPGLALFDHREGRFHLSLGDAPRARLIILDPGWTVDTEAFNAIDRCEALSKVAAGQEAAFRLLKEGVAAGDLFAIGEASALSARLHQSILYNPLVESSFALSKELSAAGLCRAHSGGIVGLIFPDDFDLKSALEYLSRRLPPTVRARPARLTGGGPIIVDEKEGY